MPKLRAAIADADNLMALWIDLRLAFDRAYESDPPDDELIAGMYSFAAWCMDAPRQRDAEHDPLTAAVIGFYEDIPTSQAARDDMPRWLPYSLVAANRPVFSYHIGDEKFDALVEYMKKNQHLYCARPSAT